MEKGAMVTQFGVETTSGLKLAHPALAPSPVPKVSAFWTILLVSFVVWLFVRTW
jgi:hypothetical protein